ncbi:hypothetical protein HHI36_019869 [Cryptolaemus montrouzieri]|uniref:Uncharacterized protein n=1 Tax=Cryptolaemus montrouzieri TaxID=559131 RepID=A0ABD2N8M3_9CUCU
MMQKIRKYFGRTCKKFGVAESEDDEEIDGGREPTAGTSGNQENTHLRTTKSQKHECEAQKREKARNAGLSYVSSGGQTVAGKLYQNFDCECKRKRQFQHFLEAEQFF